MTEKLRLTTEQIIERMVPAMTRAVVEAVNRHGRLPPSLERAALVCAEEAGELAGVVLEATRDILITKEQYEALEDRIIAENMDLLAAAIIFVMVNSGAKPVAVEAEFVDFEVDPDMKVM